MENKGKCVSVRRVGKSWRGTDRITGTLCASRIFKHKHEWRQYLAEVTVSAPGGSETKYVGQSKGGKGQAQERETPHHRAFRKKEAKTGLSTGMTYRELIQLFSNFRQQKQV